MKLLDKVKIVAVTGTKGKTSIVNLIAFILNQKYESILEVNSLGAYFNGKMYSSHADSVKVFGGSPNTSPGRYIRWNLLNNFSPYKKNYAILEAGLGAKNRGGMGSGKKHDVAIFSNVYSDHLNYENLKTKNDLLREKLFILDELKEDGLFIVNLDNPYTLKALKKVQNNKSIQKIGITLNSLDPKRTHQLGLDDLLYVKEMKIYSLKKGLLMNIFDFSYHFHKGMKENLLLAYAYLYTELGLKDLNKFIRRYKVAEQMGRYITYGKKDKRIIVDYAHEPDALKSTVDSYSNYYKKNVILVTRVTPDRPNQFIEFYAQKISKIKALKSIYVFDKIDGLKATHFYGKKLTRKAGETAGIFSEYLKKHWKRNVHCFLSEGEALAEAIKELNQTDDLLIHIHGDLEQALMVIRKSKFRRVL